MMFFMWLPFLLLIPLFMWLSGDRSGALTCGHGGHGSTAHGPEDEAIRVVRERLARGEITPEQYDEVVRALR